MAPIKRPANLENGSQNEEEPDGDYLNKRARNNDAVKRSRQKAREKANETNSRVQKLKNENEKLEEKIKLLSKELTFLKDIFLAHAGKFKRYHNFIGDSFYLYDYCISYLSILHIIL